MPRFLIPAIVLSAAVAIAAALNSLPVVHAVFKSLTTGLIILLFVVESHSDSSRFKRLILVALGLCLLGDVLLLQESRFVQGLSAFLVAHLVFLAAFIKTGGWQWHWRSFIPLAGITGFYWWHLQPALDAFMVPVAVYTTVIAVMCWQAFGLAAGKRSAATTQMAIGAAFFMFSDATIAWNKFLQPFELSPLLILSTYWLAVLLIARGAAQIGQQR